MNSKPTDYAAELHSPPHDINSVHDLLGQVWAENPQVGSSDRLRFETALVELSGNVFEHADSGLGLRCAVTVTVETERLSAVVIDTGVPLPADSGRAVMPDELAESGRGLALIHALVDELTYAREDDTNRWTLVRRLEPSTSRIPA